MLSNLGTTISSPNSEPDNHALLDEKEDSYFSEIRNFISNSEMNQASSSTDKRLDKSTLISFTPCVLHVVIALNVFKCTDSCVFKFEERKREVVI